MSIRRIIKIEPKPTQRDRLIEEFDRLIPIFRKEPGCQDYELFQSLDNPNLLLVLDYWDDWDAYGGHLKLEQEMGLDFTEFLSGPMHVEKYES